MFYKNKIFINILYHLFNNLLFLYLILLLIEQIWEKSVSAYLNFNYLLIAVIITGILTLFIKHEKIQEKKKKVTKKDYLFILFLSILGIIIVFFKTKELNILSYFISILSGIIIFLLSYIILNEDKIEKSKEEVKFSNTQIFIIIFSFLILITLLLIIFAKFDLFGAIRVVFGSFFVLFLPGYIISFIIYPDLKNINNKGIDYLERIVLSFALSISIIPLVVFYLHLIGMKINVLNVLITTAGIIIISLIILWVKNYKYGVKIESKKNK